MRLVAEIWRRPGGKLALAIVVIVLVYGIAGPWLSPYKPDAIAITARFSPPSWAHPFGTDQLGRDLATRLAVGLRLALGIAAIVLATAFGIGGLLGLLSIFLGRTANAALLVLFDTLAAFPSLILALAIVAALGPGIDKVVVIVAATLLPHYGRTVRGHALAFRESVMVEAGRAIGTRTWRIALLHVLPNIIGPLIVLVSMDLPVVITIEAGLSFLGLGVPPPLASLGTLLNDGYVSVGRSIWPIAGAAGVLAVVTLGFTLLGEALRDQLDPKLRTMP